MTRKIEYLDQILQIISAIIDAKSAQNSEFKINNDTIKEVIRSQALSYTFPNITQFSEEEIDTLCRNTETFYNIDQPTGYAITSKTYEPWFMSRKGELDFHYWKRFSSWIRTAQNIPTKVVMKLDDITDKIVDYAGDPLITGNWNRKGLIIGQVQSGKTTNYSGVICKTADAGYKVIVLLAGISNDLRRQTQERINEAFIGKNTTSLVGGGDTTIIGAAKHVQGAKHPNYFTTLERDFNINQAGGAQGIDFTNTNEPTIFVCKKNKSILTMLNNYFSNYSKNGKIDVPLLLIDDEADNASINTSKKPNETTTINRLIRDVLGKFNKSSYIGYTATPFANIFIQPNSQEEMENADLFPSDYIYALEAPTNYIGPNKIFGDDNDEISETMVNIINDYENFIPLKDPKDFIVCEIPESMREAVRVFILIKALRMERGEKNKHCTMMINPSSRNHIQEKVAELIYEYLEILKNNISVNVYQNNSKILDQLKDDYNREFLSKKPNNLDYPNWNSLTKHLIEASHAISVKVVNMRNSGLDYAQYSKEGLTAIAIGGFALSRGLTLEGLCISYVIRNASASDTLMQMGRWFGYREGYLDLCRLYLPGVTHNLYRDITLSAEELIDEVKTMQGLNKTPSEYGLKVREHESSIRITAANKMKSAEQLTFSLGFSGKHVQGHSLFISNSINNKNRKAVNDILNILGIPDPDTDYIHRTDLFWSDVNIDKVVELLRKFDFPPFCNNFAKIEGKSSYIIDYVNKCKSYLNKWDICLDNPIAKKYNEKTDHNIIDGYSITPREHHKGLLLTENVFQITSKQQVTASAVGSARYGTKKGALGTDVNGKEIIGTLSDYNDVRTKPLLLIHVFDGRLGIHGKSRDESEILREKNGNEIKNNLVTLTINFPFGLPSEKVSYQANVIYQQMSFFPNEEEQVDNEELEDINIG